MLLIDSPTLSANAWLLIGVASLLVCLGSICMLIIGFRKPSITLDEFVDRTTQTSIARNRPSAAQKEIIDGMATSGSHPAAPMDPTAASTKSAQLEGTRNRTWKDFWAGIVDASLPAARNDVAANTTPMANQPPAQPGEPEPMVDRPDDCPFCGTTPRPDYVQVSVEGGSIYSCPSCHCIVYYVPKDLAYRYRGQIYHVPEGEAFAIPKGTQTGAMTALPFTSRDIATDDQGMVINLFGDVVDKPTAH